MPTCGRPEAVSSTLTEMTGVVGAGPSPVSGLTVACGLPGPDEALLVEESVTAVVQVARIFAIYAAGRAVGIGLSPLPYVVLGPLLFLVMLVPFTINGLAVREAFFVNFLGHLHVGGDAAFACGFLFFLMTVLLALPGVFVLMRENLFRRGVSVADA